MSSEPGDGLVDLEAAGAAGPLFGLCSRLARAERLAGETRAALLRGDADAIEVATARLRTIVVEARLLAEELGRVPPGECGDQERGLAELRRATTRLARESAVAGGLLDGLVTLSRRLLETIATAQGDGYDAAGRTREPRLAGLRLRETT